MRIPLDQMVYIAVDVKSSKQFVPDMRVMRDEVDLSDLSDDHPPRLVQMVFFDCEPFWVFQHDFDQDSGGLRTTKSESGLLHHMVRWLAGLMTVENKKGAQVVMFTSKERANYFKKMLEEMKVMSDVKLIFKQ